MGTISKNGQLPPLAADISINAEGSKAGKVRQTAHLEKMANFRH
jgi:hypothetical protein